MPKRIFMNMSNARVPAQLARMKEIQKKGICPFCPEYFEEYHDAPIIRESKSWLLTKNDYPYEGAKQHLLLVHKKHIENLHEVTPKAAEEFFALAEWAVKKFKIKGGGFSMRFGDVHYNAATISHLHAHLIMGSRQHKKRERLTVQIGFK